MRLIEFIFSGFWTFIGSLIMLYVLLYFPTNLILMICHRLIRARTIRKIGYPPVYCDGDGDFKEEEEKK